MLRLRPAHIHIGVDVRSRRVAVITPVGLFWRLRIAPPGWSTEPIEEDEVYRLLARHRFSAKSWQIERTAVPV
jgi:hypothetical protein